MRCVVPQRQGNGAGRSHSDEARDEGFSGLRWHQRSRSVGPACQRATCRESECHAENNDDAKARAEDEPVTESAGRRRRGSGNEWDRSASIPSQRMVRHRESARSVSSSDGTRHTRGCGWVARFTTRLVFSLILTHLRTTALHKPRPAPRRWLRSRR